MTIRMRRTSTLIITTISTVMKTQKIITTNMQSKGNCGIPFYKVDILLYNSISTIWADRGLLEKIRDVMAE